MSDPVNKWNQPAAPPPPMFFGKKERDLVKQVNDELGHPVGDIVLREVAGIFRKVAREYDLVGRLGGEEFLVLCANTDKKAALIMAERFRKAVGENQINYGEGKTVSVTISVGVVWEQPAHETIASFLKTADDVLYSAKKNGRNRVELLDNSAL